MRKFWTRLGKGIDAQSGDCANFAEALQNVIGRGTVTCVYANQNDEENEEPTHCALRVNSDLWDSKGKITKKQLLKRAYLRDEEANPYLKDAELTKHGEIIGYRGLRSEKKIRQITNNLRRKLVEK